MDTDALLAPYCDVSGECILFRGKVHGRHGRPQLQKRFCRMAGIEWEEGTVMRWVFFQHHPDVDRDYSITMSCGNNSCVRASHCRIGVLNVSYKKYIFLQ